MAVKYYRVGPFTPPGVGTGVAYATGDQVGSGAFAIPVATISSNNLMIVAGAAMDSDDQGATLEVHLFRNNPTVASADNAAVNVTGANVIVADYLGYVTFLAADQIDLGGGRVYFGKPNGLAVQPRIPINTDTGSIYGLIVTRSTPTYTSATSLKIYFQLESNT